MAAKTDKFSWNGFKINNFNNMQWTGYSYLSTLHSNNGLGHSAVKTYGKSTADILSYWEEFTTMFLSNNRIWNSVNTLIWFSTSQKYSSQEWPFFNLPNTTWIIKIKLNETRQKRNGT